MSWTYIPATASPRITHEAGTIPARPLEVGDVVLYESGWSRIVGAVTDTRSMCQFTTGPNAPMFLAPIEGDFSNCIGEVLA